MAVHVSPARSLKTRITVFTLLIFVLSVWLLVAYGSRALRYDIESLLSKQQFAVATFLAKEVDEHLSEQLHALDESARVLGAAMSGGNAGLRQALDAQQHLIHLFNAGVVVLDRQGTVVAELPPALGRLGANDGGQPHVIDALKDARATIGKPVPNRPGEAPLLPMAAPIRDAQGDVIGALSGVMDLRLADFFGDVSGSGFGTTGGYLLVAPQHGLVVTSSIKSRIMATLPPLGANALVDRNRSGVEGTTIAVDPTHEEVLTSVKRVPVTGWLAIVRMSTAEAFAPIAALQQRLFWAATLLTLLAGWLIWRMLGRQFAPLHESARAVAALADTDLPPHALPVARDDEVGQLVGGFNQLLATLTERDAVLKQIFDTATVAIFLIDKDTRIRQANQRMAEMFALPLAQLQGAGYLDLVHPDERDVARQNTLALIANAVPAVDLDRRYLRADQTPFWGHLTCRSFAEGSAGELSMVCVIADITERKRLRDKSDRLTKLYAALSRSNEAIVHTTNAPDLFAQICRVLVEAGGMKMAFVGAADSGRQALRIEAAFGAGSEYLADNRIALSADDPLGRGPSASAWRSGQPVWCEDFLRDPSTAVWHEAAGFLGWAASASLPLRVHGAVVAVMTLFADERDVFTEDFRELLLEMSTNVGFALAGYDREAARRLSEQKVDSLFESIYDAIVTSDSAGTIVGWNHAAETLFGYNAAEAMGRDMTLLMPERFRRDHLAGMQRLRAGQPPRAAGKLREVVGLHRDGREFPLELSLARWAGVDDWFVTGVIRDNSARKEQEKQLELAARVFAQGREGVTVADAAGNIVMVNQAFTDITGYAKDEVLGQNPRLLHSGRQSPEFYRAMWQALTSDGFWAGEVWNRRKDGTLYPEWLSISALRDEHNQVVNYVANFSNLSETKDAEDRIQWLSHYDPLTGLANRALLRERSAMALSMAQRAGESLAMMLVALDHFGAVNDTLGHRVGDQVLIEMAQRLSTSVREQDTVSRLGGKEFVIVLPGTGNDGAAHLAHQLLEKLALPCLVGDHDIGVTATIGIATFPDNGADFDALLKAVDLAMRRAQIDGRKTYRFYSNEMHEQALARDVMTKALRHAAARDQFQLLYQPQVDLSTGKICGVEALLRWTHPQLGAVSPVQFIPLAEAAGLIIDIGEWVLRRACQDIRYWSDLGLEIPHVAVNVSAWQFRGNDLLQQVAGALQAAQIDPSKIYIEVTESALLDDVPRTEATLRALKDMGVKLSLDDFGTGYSALSYLKRFPFDQVKVDQSFVRDITADVSDDMLVGVIVAMAHGFGMRAIAEGVETPAQCAMVSATRCDEIQGYLFSKPVSVQAIEALLAEDRRLPANLLRA